MRRLIRNIEHRIIRAFEFWQNYWYYIGKRYGHQKAWQTASVTLPQTRV